MTPRYRRARELAGLSIGQAAKLLRVRSVDLVLDEECTNARAKPDLEGRMADLYGCSVAWLRGADPEVPEATRKMLRDADLNPTERENLLELIGSMGRKS